MSSDSKMGSADSEKGLSLFSPSNSTFPKSTDPGAVDKYAALFRKVTHRVLDEMCLEMSPQEAFEFRLQTRVDIRTVPFGNGAPPVRLEQGLAYHVTDPDWLGPDGEEIRKLIEDDNHRYRVDWGSVGKDNSTTVVFIPEDPPAHILKKKDDPYSILDPKSQSDPVSLEKANSFLERSRLAHLNRKRDFYKNFGEICLLLLPRDSFIYRLESRSVFEEYISVSRPYEDEEEEICTYGGKNTDIFDIYHSNCFEDEEFLQFLKSDGRYSVHLILAEMDYMERADGGKGSIGFVLDSLLPDVEVPDAEGKDE